MHSHIEGCSVHSPALRTLEKCGRTVFRLLDKVKDLERLQITIGVRMSHKWIVLVIIFLVCLSSCRKQPQPPRPTRSAFSAKIESILPTNWSLEEDGQEVIIGRKVLVRTYTCVAMDVSVMRDPDKLEQYVNTHGVTDAYKIRLRLMPVMNFSEYQRQKAINDQIVVTKSTEVPNRNFFEDDAMRSYDSRYRELPEYYDDSSSVYVETNLGPYECVYPDEVAHECESIRLKLDSLFRKYSTDTPRTLSRDLLVP